MTKSVLFIAVCLLISCNSTKEKKEVKNSSKVLDSNVLKIKNTLSSLTDVNKFPRNISKKNKDWNVVDVNDWCSGFWPGVLWYAYEHSGDESIKKKAEAYTDPIKAIAYHKAENHDIGFMTYCSFGNGYRLTGNKEYKEILLSAADTLATLYNPKVGSILSWPANVDQYKHNTIIDNMMNLELLFWAAKNGGSKELYNIAESHATVTMNNIIREDGSAFHLGSFDGDTGEFLKGYTHQGYSNESMWARGQGWGIYGFAMAYRETGNMAFLNTSMKLADHFLKRLPEDGIPYWDFDDPKIPNAPKDASAAAVSACGMLELSNVVKDSQIKSKYIDVATSLIEKLSSKDYLSEEVNQSLLLHSTGHYPKNSEIDVSIVYADYYFMEALLRLKKINDQNLITKN